MEVLLAEVLNGMSYAAILFLIASGFSLVYGVMGILNLAHGALYMLGAYIGLTVAAQGGGFLLGVLTGAAGATLIGLLLERVFLSRLYKQINAQVLLTLGFVYIFENAVLWIWGPYAKMGSPPAILSGFISIGEMGVPIYRFMLIFIGLAVAACLWWFQEKTRVGAIIRAGMADKQMTIGLGIHYTLISSAVFLLGSFTGGIAGFIGAPAWGAYHTMSMDMLLLALAVVVIGGIGNVQGALIGAVIIGLIDAIGRAYYPDFAMFIIYLLMIIILLIKPSGILGRKRQ